MQNEIKLKNNYLNNKHIIYAFLMGISLTTSRVNIDVGFAIKPIMIVAFIIAIDFFKSGCSFNKKEKQMVATDIALLLFWVIYSMSILFSSNKLLSLRYILGFLLYMCIYAIITIHLDLQRKGFFDFFVLGSLIGLTLGLVYYLMAAVHLNFSFLVDNTKIYGMLIDRNLPRFIGLAAIDPNIAFMNITIGLFITYLVENKILKFCSYVIHLLSAFLTMSRGGLISLTITVLISILLYFFVGTEKSKKRSISKNKLAVVLILLLVFFIAFSDIPMLIINRFKVSDGGSGRTNLWKLGYNFFKESKYLGVGIFNMQLYLTEALGRPANLHNTQLDILFEGGFLSIASYLIFVYTVIESAFYIKNKTLNVLVLVFICLTLQQFFLSALLNESFFVSVALIATYIRQTNILRHSHAGFLNLLKRSNNNEF